MGFLWIGRSSRGRKRKRLATHVQLPLRSPVRSDSPSSIRRKWEREERGPGFYSTECSSPQRHDARKNEFSLPQRNWGFRESNDLRKVPKKEKGYTPRSVWPETQGLFLQRAYYRTWLWYCNASDSRSPRSPAGSATPFLSLSWRVRVWILSLPLPS